MKKIVLVSLFLLLPLLLINKTTYLNSTQIVREQCQEVISPEKIEYAARYESLIPILNKYKRPITILDLDADQGYLSYLIAKNYPATYVMIETDYNEKSKTTNQLENICKLNTSLSTIIVLKKRFSYLDLKRLGECEHFDLVLAFNTLYHFRTDWREITDALFTLGDNIIIAIAAQDSAIGTSSTIPLLNSYLKKKAAP